MSWTYWIYGDINVWFGGKVYGLHLTTEVASIRPVFIVKTIIRKEYYLRFTVWGPVSSCIYSYLQISYVRL